METIVSSVNPTCTGTSVMAVCYDGGVAIATDKVVSYGKTARYKGATRQYVVNDHCVVAFGGDFADFQFLQNVIERRADALRTCNRSLEMTPSMLHSYLSSFLYFRRSKMNPLWNTLIVAGMQPIEMSSGEFEPFLGIITMRGVAYKTKSVATGLGAMLLNQLIEKDVRAKEGKQSKEEAVNLLRKAIELAVYHDCVAGQEFDLSTVDKERGAVLLPTEKVVGDWSLATSNCQYE